MFDAAAPILKMDALTWSYEICFNDIHVCARACVRVCVLQLDPYFSERTSLVSINDNFTICRSVSQHSDIIQSPFSDLHAHSVLLQERGN